MRGGENHFAHHRQTVRLKEHMFGAAQPDALGFEVAGHGGICRRVGIGAHTQIADRVGPFHQLQIPMVLHRRQHLCLPDQGLACRAIER